MKERMTLRHKNTSKWARTQLKRGANMDSNTRKAVQEQLRLGQELRDTMDRPNANDNDGDGGGDSDSDSDSSSSGSDDGELDSDGETRQQQKQRQTKSRAIDQTKLLLRDIDQEASESGPNAA